MALNSEFGHRAREALRKWESSHDPKRLSFREIGERVAALVGRQKPFSHAAARAWIMDGQEPATFAITSALASVLEAGDRWLAFGEERAEPPLVDEPEELSPDAFEEMPAPRKGAKRA
jgi:hypothetical protein